jgi:hypothetical protein
MHPSTHHRRNIMAKKQIKNISDKLSKVNENFTINMYDNGFMIEVSGKDSEDDWKAVKLMVQSVDELIVLIKEVTELPRDE